MHHNRRKDSKGTKRRQKCLLARKDGRSKKKQHLAHDGKMTAVPNFAPAVNTFPISSNSAKQMPQYAIIKVTHLSAFAHAGGHYTCPAKEDGALFCTRVYD